MTNTADKHSMNKITKPLLLAIAAIGISAPLAACGSTTSTDADVASHNISEDADNFKINRRIVFINGITDRYLLVIQGYCSISTDGQGGKVDVTCDVGGGKLKKHMLGLSDNVTFFLEQLDPAKVSKDRYKVTFKPEALLPDIDMRTSKDKSIVKEEEVQTPVSDPKADKDPVLATTPAPEEDKAASPLR